ncbi:MAG TPA: hypothetical protein VGH34_20670 [Vicinamibacterales bacterium]|jgi:hypothetical protein
MNVFVAAGSGTIGRPYLARITAVRMPLSNAAAKTELGWRLKYPTLREGLAPLLRCAA